VVEVISGSVPATGKVPYLSINLLSAADKSQNVLFSLLSSILGSLIISSTYGLISSFVKHL
jgi:hypothetical protein